MGDVRWVPSKEFLEKEFWWNTLQNSNLVTFVYLLSHNDKLLIFLGGNLLCDLKLLLTAEHDRLQHLVGADVGLEVLHIPQFSDQLSKPVLHK